MHEIEKDGDPGARLLPETGRSRLRTVIRRIALVALVTFAALVLLEFSLRGLGLALSGGATHEKRRPGESDYTILCVGDSWTHGLDSVSYGEALETKLNARDDGVVYRVIRSGIPGSNSSQGLARLPRLLSDHQPDLVVVLLGNNDHQNLARSQYWKFQEQGAGRFHMWNARASVFVHSLRTYKLFRTVRLQLSGRPTLDRFFFADGTRDQADKATVIDLATHRRQLEYNLTRIVDLARVEGVELVFMTYFYFHGYEVNESILDVATSYDVPVVNNTVNFHERIPIARRDDYFAGAHPTTNGHAFIADNIIEVMENL